MTIIIIDPLEFGIYDRPQAMLSKYPSGNVLAGADIHRATQCMFGHEMILEGIVCCVSTPADHDGSCISSNVSDVIWYAESVGIPVLVKSTVTPDAFVDDYTENSLVTFSPEFIQGTTRLGYMDQYKEFTYEIYGSDNPANGAFWKNIFEPVLPHRTEWIITNLFDAVFTKYVANSYLATRVTFFSEMRHAYDAASKRFVGDNTDNSFENMTDLVSRDPRIGNSHMQVPGADGKFGYGGHCLPKDVKALIQQLDHIGFHMPLMKFIDTYNKDLRDIT